MRKKKTFSVSSVKIMLHALRGRSLLPIPISFRPMKTMFYWAPCFFFFTGAPCCGRDPGPIGFSYSIFGPAYAEGKNHRRPFVISGEGSASLSEASNRFAVFSRRQGRVRGGNAGFGIGVAKAVTPH